MWPEPPLHLLLELFAVQGSDSTTSLIHGLSTSEEGSCGGPWGMGFCPIIFLSFMVDKTRLDLP